MSEGLVCMSSSLSLKVSLLLIITMEIITLHSSLCSSQRSRYCNTLDADKSLLFSALTSWWRHSCLLRVMCHKTRNIPTPTRYQPPIECPFRILLSNQNPLRSCFMFSWTLENVSRLWLCQVIYLFPWQQFFCGYNNYFLSAFHIRPNLHNFNYRAASCNEICLHREGRVCGVLMHRCWAVNVAKY